MAFENLFDSSIAKLKDSLPTPKELEEKTLYKQHFVEINLKKSRIFLSRNIRGHDVL
jgi:hypothetical protein